MALHKGQTSHQLAEVARGKTRTQDIAKGGGPLPNPTGLTKGQPGHLQTVKRSDFPASTPGPNTPPGGRPAPPSTLIQPFLTPAQSEALNQTWLTYTQSRNNAVSNIENQRAATDNGTYQAGQQHLRNTAATNQNLAARGLGLSSIRDGALNDIDATYAYQTNLLNAQWKTTYLKNMSDIGTLDTGWASSQANSDVQKVENAAAQTPVLPGPTPTTNQAAANGTDAAGSTASAQAGMQRSAGVNNNQVNQSQQLAAQGRQRAAAATPQASPQGAPSNITKGQQGPTLTKVAKGGAKLNGG